MSALSSFTIRAVAPSRERGLKRMYPPPCASRPAVAPSRERGLKHLTLDGTTKVSRRSLTGAWIETRWQRHHSELPAVAPSRERGLKLGDEAGAAADGGRSLTGAWIETSFSQTLPLNTACRSLTGAWIETQRGRRSSATGQVAPSRERGLKPERQRCV